jgi:hypothetical protein
MYVPPTATIFPRLDAVSGTGDQPFLTSVAPGWFGLRSSSWVSSSRSSPMRPRRRQTALRDQARAPCPDERTATMSRVAPQKPLRAARRLFKATGSTSSRSDGPRQATARGIETPIGSERLPGTASSQLVLGSACGQPRRAMVARVSSVFSAFTGPRRGGQSKANGVGHVTQRAKGMQRDPVPLLHGLLDAFALVAPVRPTAPRAGPVVSP